MRIAIFLFLGAIFLYILIVVTKWILILGAIGLVYWVFTKWTERNKV